MLLHDLLDKLPSYKEVTIKAVHPELNDFKDFTEVRIENLVMRGQEGKNWTFKFKSYLSAINGKLYEAVPDPKKVGYVKTWKSWKALIKKMKEELKNIEVEVAWVT